MWTVVQSTGKLSLNDTFVESCYSGQPPHVNDSAAEGLVGQGPLPKGNWKMVRLLINTQTHGPYVIVLEPDAATRARIVAMGRDPDSFRCHGERLEPPPGLASDGCLIASHPTRVVMWEGEGRAASDHDLECV